MKSLERAADNSAVIASLRRLAAGSVFCRAIVALVWWPKVNAWLRQTQQRILIGFGGEWSQQEERNTVERLDHLASTSRVVAGLMLLVRTPIVAWRESGLRRLMQETLSFDLEYKIRVGGWAVIVAVLTHTVLLELLGVPVHVLGWSCRPFLLAAGVVGLRRSQAVAAAWRNKQATR